MPTPTPIQLDLRRDLPKVREALDAGETKPGRCLYSAPCAIGAMMTPEQRRSIPNGYDGIFVGSLIKDGLIAAPLGQQLDLERLQDAFDGGQRFDKTLAELEAKYLGKAS